MTHTARTASCAALLVALATTVAIGVARANHYILPKGDQCVTGPLAYIGNESSNFLTVIDTETNTVVATVDVGQTTSGVAINPAGTRVYMANSRDVVVIDTGTNEVIARITYGVYPDLFVGIAFNATGTRAYVADGQAQGIAVIDTATNTLIGTVNSGYYTALGVATSPDDERVYVTNGYDDTMSVIDGASDTVTATIPIDNPYTVPPTSAGNFSALPIGIALNAAGTRAYLANVFLSDQAGGDVYMSIIDTTTNTLLANVPTGPSASLGIAINPAGTRVYLSNGAIVDTSSNSVVGRFAPLNFVGSAFNTTRSGIAFNPSGTRIYDPQDLSSSVLVIDTETGAVVATIPVDGAPFAFGQFIGPAGECP